MAGTPSLSGAEAHRAAVDEDQRVGLPSAAMARRGPSGGRAACSWCGPAPRAPALPSMPTRARPVGTDAILPPRRRVVDTARRRTPCAMRRRAALVGGGDRLERRRDAAETFRRRGSASPCELDMRKTSCPLTVRADERELEALFERQRRLVVLEQDDRLARRLEASCWCSGVSMLLDAVLGVVTAAPPWPRTAPASSGSWQGA